MCFLWWKKPIEVVVQQATTSFSKTDVVLGKSDGIRKARECLEKAALVHGGKVVELPVKALLFSGRVENDGKIIALATVGIA